jgi:hypothetical protein
VIFLSFNPAGDEGGIVAVPLPSTLSGQHEGGKTVKAEDIFESTRRASAFTGLQLHANRLLESTHSKQRKAKRFITDNSLYTNLQVLSVTVFERIPLLHSNHKRRLQKQGRANG